MSHIRMTAPCLACDKINVLCLYLLILTEALMPSNKQMT